MIISVSRRTDIPAFYSKWFMNRIRAGYCTVVNPYNHNQVSYVSLLPEDVDVIVFWTKNPEPMIPYLRDLDKSGYRYYFQYTLNAYSKELEQSAPSMNTAIDMFTRLASLIGPDKIIWRYDPICISNITDVSYHETQFRKIAEVLSNSTHRSVISIVDNYKRAEHNFKRLAHTGISMRTSFDKDYFAHLLSTISACASANNMEIFSCAEAFDFSSYGINHGKCIDAEYINKIWGLNLSVKKDRNQREECGCVESKDVGAYDTCLHGCAYCYATTPATACRNYKLHNPDSPSLLGYYDITKSANEKASLRMSNTEDNQIKLFD